MAERNRLKLLKYQFYLDNNISGTTWTTNTGFAHAGPKSLLLNSTSDSLIWISEFLES